jgi:lipopolysaccharide transport system permease protein
LIANSNLLSKIYFPRILVPASSVLVALVDFLISLLLLGGMMIYFGITPSWRLIILPFFLLIAFASALGIGFLFSALNIRYRDFQFVVPFLLQFGLYVSPVGFVSKVIPDNISALYALNPMVGVIDGFRWAILGDGFELRPHILLQSIVTSAVLLFCGIMFFRRFERDFADVV